MFFNQDKETQITMSTINETSSLHERKCPDIIHHFNNIPNIVVFHYSVKSKNSVIFSYRYVSYVIKQ